MTTQSTEEAMGLLAEYRASLIRCARVIARKIAKAQGTVHSRQVRAEMASLGMLNDPDLNDFWLGAVFRSSEFVWTGAHHVYSDEDRNIHERTVKVWKLK